MARTEFTDSGRSGSQVETVDRTDHRCSVACPGVFDDYSFALCLTHDVDRVYKTYQSLYDAVTQRRPSDLKTLVSDVEPYWQFEEIMAIEEEFGVRSSFYFLDEKRLFRDKPGAAALDPRNWTRYTGHYRIEAPALVEIIRKLERGGWEIGLHGSYDSYGEPERLTTEKERLEGILGHSITGGRQHYLNLDIPETWRYHREMGLKYDASLGSSSEWGFRMGPQGVADAESNRYRSPYYGVIRPFDDEFLVFPLTVMDAALMESAPSVDAAWASLRDLLREAAENRAVMTIVWHPRLFNRQEFPGYRTVYERLLEEAESLGAWIGPVEDAYREIVRSDCPTIDGDT